MCGEEMVLIRIVEDTGKMVRGFERQSWQCSKCFDVEHRFVFTREKRIVEQSPLQPTDADARERALPSSMQTDVEEPSATPSNSDQGSTQIQLVPDDPHVQFSDGEPAKSEYATSMQIGLEKHTLSNPEQGSIHTLPSGPSSAPVDPLTETVGREPHVHAGAWIRAVTKLRSWQSLKD